MTTTTLEKAVNDLNKAFGTIDDGIYVPDEVYVEADYLLSVLDENKLQMPDDIGILRDGGIGFEWRTDNSIATASLYAECSVIYGCNYLNDSEKNVKGKCSLMSDRITPFIVFIKDYLK